jgi:DNA-binding transcriptional ArsR family regulator
MTTGKRLVAKVSHAARQFQAVGNPYRLAILVLLAENPMTAGSIAKSVGLPDSLASHHLKFLTQAGWITKSIKVGRIVRYSLAAKPLKELKKTLSGKLD